MKLRRPSFYKDFACIGGPCEDSCCIGWEIEIDKKTAALYSGTGGDFGKRLTSSIAVGKEGEESSFILNGPRCPFLNEQNYCDIIITLGEDAICEVCRDCPRFYDRFDGYTEVGLGLCCQEAGKLLFSNPSPITFETVESEPAEQADIPSYDKAFFDAVFSARETAFVLAQNRKFSITERLALLIAYADDIQLCIDNGDLDTLLQLTKQYHLQDFCENLLAECKGYSHDVDKFARLQELIGIYQAFEPLDAAWYIKLDEIKSDLASILNAESDFIAAYQERIYEYEHLLVYFISRYFIKAVFDEDFFAKACLAVSGIILVKLTDIAHWRKSGDFTLYDRIQLAKAYSKELEHSTANFTAFEQSIYQGELFSFSSLMSIIF